MAKVAHCDGSVTVNLHKRETGAYWGHPGISTVTFCEGSPETVLTALKPRLRAVIDANPWIAGKLVAKKLVQPATSSDAIVNEMLLLSKCAAVSRSTKYPDLVKALADLGVAKADTIQKLGRRVTKLVVVAPEVAGGDFALVFSMSHVAADGHNYYRIYNMIAGTAPVEVLIDRKCGPLIMHVVCVCVRVCICLRAHCVCARARECVFVRVFMCMCLCLCLC